MTVLIHSFMNPHLIAEGVVLGLSKFVCELIRVKTLLVSFYVRSSKANNYFYEIFYNMKNDVMLLPSYHGVHYTSAI